MTQWDHRENRWFARSFDAGTRRLRVVPGAAEITQIAFNYDHGKTEDAKDLRRRLRTTALLTAGVYDDAKALIEDLRVDGHGSAAARVADGLLLLKKAEVALEEARELVAVK